MRSGKEVGGASPSKKKMVNKDDDEGVVDSKVDDGMKGKKDDKYGVEENTNNKEQSKKGEPKVNFRTLPFLQMFIRHNLDKQFGTFLDYMKDMTITIPFIDAVRDMPS